MMIVQLWISMKDYPNFINFVINCDGKPSFQMELGCVRTKLQDTFIRKIKTI